MDERPLACFCADPTPAEAEAALPLYIIRPAGIDALCATLPPARAAYLRASLFTGRAAQTVLLPAESGLGGAVFGLGDALGPHIYGALPAALPAGTLWRLSGPIEDAYDVVLGFALGAYRFDSLKSRPNPARPGPRLVLPDAARLAATLSAARATWLVRDLVNLPANLLGPAELAAAATHALEKTSAHTNVIADAQLRERYPILHAVASGSARPPAVFIAQWRGSGAGDAAPLVSLCGKGVCFDTGGYDLKPPSGMLRMKKDMAGAAIALGLSRMIIEADLPVRLELRLGCVENMISGDALRPLDVVTTRHGLSVEVGNTDAEGRLVLCDLLAEACAARPDVLMDFATLTGAARAALGPDLPALFSNDDGIAGKLFQAGNAVHDPVWRMPLWEGYNSWLDSGIADLNNVSEKLHAGAIVAALFLQRFVSAGTRWVHFDVYGWNDSALPGRPAGGEAQAMRAAFSTLSALAAPVAANAER